MLRALVVSTSWVAKRRHPCTVSSPSFKTLRFSFIFFKQPWTHLYYRHTSFNYWLSSSQEEIQGIARRNNAFIQTKSLLRTWTQEVLDKQSCKQAAAPPLPAPGPQHPPSTSCSPAQPPVCASCPFAPRMASQQPPPLPTTPQVLLSVLIFYDLFCCCCCCKTTARTSPPAAHHTE